jgi:transposase-like protein
MRHPRAHTDGISTRSEATAMPQNPIQFQPGMSLDDFFTRYGTEAQCAAALEASRWPLGFVCPHCGATAHSRFHADGREYWQCAQCRAQTSLTCGTLFESSKLPLTKWFQAFYLVTQNKNDLSALSLKRHLGVCYRTAWRLKHKLLEAMAERESSRMLTGTVVADDAVVGGKRSGGKRGRGAEGKAVFIAAVELDDDGHPQHVRFDPLPDLKGETLRVWVRTALDPTAHLVTDAYASLACAGAEVASYGPIVVSPRQSSEIDAFRWVNTVISNLKTAIRGTYHHIKVHKYLARYLAEAQYRLNRRFDLPSLVGRLLHASVRTQPSPETWLRLGAVRAA